MVMTGKRGHKNAEYLPKRPLGGFIREMQSILVNFVVSINKHHLSTSLDFSSPV